MSGRYTTHCSQLQAVRLDSPTHIHHLKSHPHERLACTTDGGARNKLGVLHVGCGAGNTVLQLSTRGQRAHGVESHEVCTSCGMFGDPYNSLCTPPLPRARGCSLLSASLEQAWLRLVCSPCSVRQQHGSRSVTVGVTWVPLPPPAAASIESCLIACCTCLPPSSQTLSLLSARTLVTMQPQQRMHSELCSS